MIPDKVAFAVADAAKQASIEPAALLALVEVETNGAAFEQDGRTPQFLYERHIAWREAVKAGGTSLRDAFARAGLAIPKWSRSTQYRDQRTSAQRLDLIRRAKAIDEETALRSASWGLGQTMGFLSAELGFSSAREMVAHQTGSIAGQLDCLVSEIENKHLTTALNGHDWAHVARIYNGSGYRANNYDGRLADAYKRWCRRLVTLAPAGKPRPAPPEQALSAGEVRQVQERLRELGYAEVGAPDGKWGTRTAGAVSAFQAHEGLPVTGHYDADTAAAMNVAEDRPVAFARTEASADDLAAEGSRTVVNAGQVSTVGRWMQWAGFGGAGLKGADSLGVIDKIKGATEHVGQVREVFDGLADVGAWAVGHWWVFAIGAGLVLVYRAERIVAARLEDHRTGVHAG